MLEEVVGSGNHIVMDSDMALSTELIDQLLRRGRRRYLIGLALDDNARRRAWRKESEVIEVGGRCNRDEALDLGPAHQQLHADPGAKADTRNPGRLCFGVDRLNPIKRARRIGQFANTIIENALAFAHAAEIEAQRREAATHERLVQLLHDAVVHRAARLGMRMEDHGDRRARTRRWAETTFEAAFGAGENDVGHRSRLTIGAGMGASAGRAYIEKVLAGAIMETSPVRD